MPKPKTISEIEKMFDEKFKHSQFVDYSKIKSFLRTALQKQKEDWMEKIDKLHYRDRPNFNEGLDKALSILKGE